MYCNPPLSVTPMGAIFFKMPCSPTFILLTLEASILPVYECNKLWCEVRELVQDLVTLRPFVKPAMNIRISLKP
jgi:hypothetical protein